MAVEIPETEPTSVRAGDTWAWDRTDLSADYPASTWTLTYTFINADSKFQITAASDGDDFSVSVAASTTATRRAGTYTWVAKVSAAGEVYTIDSGTLEVLPDIATVNTYDGRSHAKKVLEAIEAVLEGRASTDQQEFTVAGTTLRRTPVEDLLRLRGLYRREVANEQAAENLANGTGIGRVIGVRF